MQKRFAYLLMFSGVFFLKVSCLSNSVFVVASEKSHREPKKSILNATLHAAPAPGHHKIEVTPAVAMGDPGKGGRANETVTPTLTAQVGGACSIVHVLEWKEGMAILPSSNLKVNLCCCF